MSRLSLSCKLALENGEFDRERASGRRGRRKEEEEEEKRRGGNRKRNGVTDLETGGAAMKISTRDILSIKNSSVADVFSGRWLRTWCALVEKSPVTSWLL